jgi:hypothetical protein
VVTPIAPAFDRLAAIRNNPFLAMLTVAAVIEAPVADVPAVVPVPEWEPDPDEDEEGEGERQS